MSEKKDKEMLMKKSTLLNKQTGAVMFRRMGLAAIICAGIWYLCGAAGAEAATKQGFMVPSSFSSLAEQVSPVVVNIRTVKTTKGGGRVFRHFFRGPRGKGDPFEDFFNKFFGEERQREFKQRSLGSGFIIDKEGYIVTNHHVVENADEIQVILNDGKEYDAEIVGRDANTDIALIKIKAPNDLPVVTFGSSAMLKVGQWVVAIGSPFGLEHTVTAGIVSAKGRVIGSGPYDDFIQTDASINPGNSGGPLINMEGKVVGINTAIVAGGQGIGFAIPIDMAKGIIDQLREHGNVTRGWLGVVIKDIDDELADYFGIKDRKGALVIDVVPGDPADKAGIKPKDIIVAVNGKPVDSSRDLTRMIANVGVGDDADVSVIRNGKPKTYTVTIAKRDDEKIARRGQTEPEEDELGIQVAKITPEIAQRFNIKEAEEVIVVGVEPDSKGEEAGLRPGDIIKEVNHDTILSVEAYLKAIDNVKSGETIQMFIRRLNVGFMVIKLTK
jgi:serine protease Do